MENDGRIVRDHAAEAIADAQIAKDCAAIGVTISGPWDFVGERNDHLWSMEVAEILAEHLQKELPSYTLMGIMLAGSWLETRHLFLDPVLKILRENGNNMLGQIAANALLQMADKRDADVFRTLIIDKEVGVSRALLIEGFAKLAKQHGIDVLRNLVGDRQVRTDVLKALSKLGDQSIADELRLLAQHTESYHRKIGREGLARLEKKQRKG
jgi:hypothetical protein